jgi:hypothetical protein
MLHLAECKHCNVCVWDEEILTQFRYPTIAPLSKEKTSQIYEYPEEN